MKQTNTEIRIELNSETAQQSRAANNRGMAIALLSLIFGLTLGIVSCYASQAESPTTEGKTYTIEYTATQSITPKLKGHDPYDKNYADPDCDFKVISHEFDVKSGKGVITIDRPIKVIATGAFATCETMTSITIPSSVTTIKAGAFALCHGLTYLHIPDTVTSIGKGAFMRCENLKEVRLPNNMKTIPYELFYYSRALERVTIPEGVTEIEGKAFWGCESLKYMHIPESVTKIGYCAFYRCLSIESFTGKFATDDRCALIVDNHLVAFANGRNLSSYTIPLEVHSIERGLMDGNMKITSITLTENIKFIGHHSFNCPNLKSVYCNIATPPLTECGNFHHDYLEPDGGEYYQDSDRLGLRLAINYIYDWDAFGSLPYKYNPNDKDSLKIYIPAGSVERYCAGEEDGSSKRSNYKADDSCEWYYYKQCFVEVAM